MSKIGLISGLAAYIIWGLLPIYWKALVSVDALEILSHRIIWSVLFLLLILIVKKQWVWLKIVLHKPLKALPYLISSILLSVNWFTYIWAVNNEYIVEASLGYFINPLIYVLLGVILLKESLRKIHVAAILLAATGVLYMTISAGKPPWIALILAFSFGMYGLMKKLYPLSPVEGLSLETFLMAIPALIYVIVLSINSHGSFCTVSLRTTILLIMAGAATSLPLLFFAKAAKNLSLTNLGILQYIAPTIQFLIGVLLYREEFPIYKLIGFSIVWIALIVYTIENVIFARSKRKFHGSY